MYEDLHLVAPKLMEEKLSHGFTRLIQHYWIFGGSRDDWEYGYFVLARDWEKGCGYAALIQTDDERIPRLGEKTDMPLEELEGWSEQLDQIRYPRLDENVTSFPGVIGVFAIDDSRMLFKYSGDFPKGMKELRELIRRIESAYHLRPRL